MKHPSHVEGWSGSLADLAKAIGHMRYDQVREFLRMLALEFEDQSAADLKKERRVLAAGLMNLARSLSIAQDHAAHVWKVCKPYMPS